MNRTLRVLVGGAALVAALAACHPTGDPRCDARYDAQAGAEAMGYRYDCTPPMPNRIELADGGYQYVVGWTDYSTRTLYVWADQLPDDRTLLKVMFHELGHAHYPNQGEMAAECWAWFNMTPAQREGIGFLHGVPADC